ncbi:MAG: hypothetical protein A2252_11680 [Elusimicrobia bacterium RIFOXYA2_FULL_39_19]|nr:MAG: hypothetical protein A2252_11680 [Elusimicrobia bacterium RIFOXYA2_FULL_39_19]
MTTKVFFLTFIPLFVAVDALGTVPLLLGFTKDMDFKEVKKIIRKSIFFAFLLGVSFILVGKAIFEFLSITTPDFMIAGGALLFILSIITLIGKEQYHAITKHLAAVPLATPLLIGPGVLSTLLILVDLYSWPIVIISFFANMVVAGIIFINADYIKQIFGEAFIEILSKIASLLLAAIGVMLFRKGVISIISDYFSR